MARDARHPDPDRGKKAASIPGRHVAAESPVPPMRSRSWAVVRHLFGATVVVQMAVLLATTFSAALLTPRDFALFGAVFGVAGIANSFNTLGVELRIAVVERAALAGLLSVGLASMVTLAAVGTVLALVPVALGRPSWGLVLGLGMVASVTLAVQLIANAFTLRRSAHEVLVRSRIAQGMTNAVLIVALVPLPLPGYLALSTAWILSMVIGVLISLAGLGWPVPDHWCPTAHDRRATRQEVGVQPVTGLLAGLTMQLPLLMFPAFGAPVIAGAWALAARILGAAVFAVFNVTQPVYYATAALRIRDGDLRGLASWHRRWAWGLIVLSVPSLAGAGVLIHYGLPLLGSQWEPAQLLVIPACLYWGSVLLTLPLSQTLPAVARTDLQFKWEAARLLTALAALALWPVWGAVNSVWAWSLACVAAALALVALQLRVLRRMAELRGSS